MENSDWREGKETCLEKWNCATNSHSDFVKQFLISPDGQSVLISFEECHCEVRALNLELLNQYSYQQNDTNKSIKSTQSTILESISAFSTAEIIYDMKWYPLMNSSEPGTNCFLTTSKDQPIHLWDVITGKLRCSYVGHNNLDELDVAVSLSFNLFGNKIYSGSDHMIRCFDVENPGKNGSTLPTAKTKKSTEGQKGLISCFAFNPDYSGAFAVGSYGKSIMIHVENTHEVALELNNLDFGITHMKWSPCGNNLWAGGRNHDDIICWDLRNLRNEIGRVHRSLRTNQKFTFDLDPWGTFLTTGSDNGELKTFRTSTFELVDHQTVLGSSMISGQESGNNCIHSVVYHPYSSLLLTANGQRSYPVESSESDSDESDIGDFEGDDSFLHSMLKNKKKIISKKPEKKMDHGLQIWSVA